MISVLVVALIALLVFLPGGGSHHRHSFKVPYGEEMTAHDFTEIHVGEEDAVVLERLRPPLLLHLQRRTDREEGAQRLQAATPTDAPGTGGLGTIDHLRFPPVGLRYLRLKETTAAKGEPPLLEELEASG